MLCYIIIYFTVVKEHVITVSSTNEYTLFAVAMAQLFSPSVNKNN